MFLLLGKRFHLGTCFRALKLRNVYLVIKSKKLVYPRLLYTRYQTDQKDFFNIEHLIFAYFVSYSLGCALEINLNIIS